MEKIALVTGANRGIGLEISKQLAAQGITVVLTARNMQTGRPLVNELRQQWKHTWFHQLDVTDEASIQDLYNYLAEDCGHLDILINNAGIFIDDGLSALNITLDSMRQTMETNLYGPMRLVQVMIPLLKRSDDGRIINLSSTMGQLSSMAGRSPAYRISKAALNALTVILADELNGTKVKVNSMHPGWVRTEMGGSTAPKSVEDGSDTAVWLATADNIPNGQFVQDRKVIAW